MPNLSQRWHGAPLWVWYAGSGVAAGVGFYVWRKRGKAGAAAATNAVSTQPTTDNAQYPTGSSGGGTAGGGIGTGGPLGDLTDVFGKFLPPQYTDLPPQPAPTPTPTPVPVGSGEVGNIVNTATDAINQALAAAQLSASQGAVTPSAPPVPAPPPVQATQPADVMPALAQPVVAGLPAGTPGTSVVGGYTVPSGWVPDIQQVLQTAFTPNADNTGKPFTFDSPVPDWQKFGFGSQQQYDDAQQLAQSYTVNNPPTLSERLMQGQVYQTPFGPTDRANWELGHSQGRW